ncbi:MAG: Clp protease ClpP [Sulfurimonas sp.]|nr:Clp protease ClpP [Sulfurimonas sp.]
MNKILIDSDITCWGFSSRWLSRELSEMKGDIEVTISSLGGDVFEGISMFNALRNYSKEKGKVTTIVNGKAMSIASLLFLAGDVKKAYENSTIMIHKSWTWLSGNADDLQKESNILNSIDLIMAKTYGKYMKGSEKSILDIMAKEGWYIGREQLEKTNFVDEFILTDNETQTINKEDYTGAMARFSAKAIEQQINPDLEMTRKSILDCNDGQCPMVASSEVSVPTASDSEKPEEIKKGNTMTKEEVSAIQAQNKILMLNRDTLKARIETLEVENKVALDSNRAAVVNFENQLSEIQQVMQSRIREAFATNVASEPTILAMILANNDKDSSEIAIAAKSNTESLNQGETLDVKKESDIAMYARLNKGSIR